MNRYLCIHSHFYQPPRESPWLEAIEQQDSAYPYHDWNERIMAECYAPNLATRILDSGDRIEKIVNNYAAMSFNFGPTLLSWIQEKAPEAYQGILKADCESRKRFSGHGSAIAQAYNHIIMPLANARDKRTQVHWGIVDFQHRFGRKPEGMWLPETAVDIETLECLAEAEIAYTVLAPSQAGAVRAIGAAGWTDVSNARIDPTRSYNVPLPSGRSIAVFFYDGPVSRAVAFEKLLDNGGKFATRLLSGFSDARTWPQLMHIATDGETYGHHHRYGEMALAYALEQIESKKLAVITNYGEFLKLHPPVHEAQIIENTAWSCSHGVGRWSRDCSCNSGAHPGWNQSWRAPLREALDYLRDTVAPLYEEAAALLLNDPWKARDEYIRVVLNRSPENREQFLDNHARGRVSTQGRVRIWKLLELQRQAMLMYTSCGWFFDDISGIETVQVIEYAGRVVQLAEELFSISIESEFLSRLARARSNDPVARDGAHIYEQQVLPARVDMPKLAAHYAITSVFDGHPEQTHIYCYSALRESDRSLQTGKVKMGVGRALFVSEVTQQSDELMFGVLHFGDHNVHAGVRAYDPKDTERYSQLVKELTTAFERADLPEVIRLMDRGFDAGTYSLKSLFKDEQRRILSQVLTGTLEEAENAYRQLYEHHAPFMRFLADVKMPLPDAMRTAAEYALNHLLRKALSADALDQARIAGLVEEARRTRVSLDETTLEFTIRRNIERISDLFSRNPEDLALLSRLQEAVIIAGSLPFAVVFWSIQNNCYALLQSVYPKMVEASRADESVKAWVTQFQLLGNRLSLRLPAV